MLQIRARPNADGCALDEWQIVGCSLVTVVRLTGREGEVNRQACGTRQWCWKISCVSQKGISAVPVVTCAWF